MDKQRQTFHIFLIYFALAGIVVLSLNTYLLIENQNEILENQAIMVYDHDKEILPIINDTNKKVVSIEEMILPFLIQSNNLSK